jgi:predicted negative regulator of RcsB-dependent stress response
VGRLAQSPTSESTNQEEHEMIESRSGFWRRTGVPLVAAALLALSGVALATEQSQQRQQGRDTNQAAKQEARSAKVDCRAENNKSNAECRQDKRDTKQQGRQDKREIKY